MDEKKILNFINDVILENGIEKELKTCLEYYLE